MNLVSIQPIGPRDLSPRPCHADIYIQKRMTRSFKTVHQKILKVTEGPYQLASFQRHYLCVYMATNPAKKIKAVKKFTLLESTSFMATEINR